MAFALLNAITCDIFAILNASLLGIRIHKVKFVFLCSLNVVWRKVALVTRMSVRCFTSEIVICYKGTAGISCSTADGAVEQQNSETQRRRSQVPLEVVTPHLAPLLSGALPYQASVSGPFFRARIKSAASRRRYQHVIRRGVLRAERSTSTYSCSVLAAGRRDVH